MKKKVLGWFGLVVGVYLIVVLSRDLWRILGSKKRVEVAEDEISRLEKERLKFEGELALVESDDFVEKEARDKLLLGKEGEVVVLLPEKEIQVTKNKKQEEIQGNLKNWQRWMKVFGFGTI